MPAEGEYEDDLFAGLRHRVISGGDG
jgi:hypothetical protein